MESDKIRRRVFALTEIVCATVKGVERVEEIALDVPVAPSTMPLTLLRTTVLTIWTGRSIETPP
jgi:hypothetical protein